MSARFPAQNSRKALEVPRRNRVDPFGDLHAVSSRGMFTGNRGCLVDEEGRLARHHRGQLWITCVTSYDDSLHPLDKPGTWTPLFFLDDAVALAAGHRPCGFCRRDDYRSYQSALTSALGLDRPIPATEQNRRLAAERLRRGRGLERAADRRLWKSDLDSLPDGTVIVIDSEAHLLYGDRLLEFSFEGWIGSSERRSSADVEVLTPPSSVLALRYGFEPRLHESASRQQFAEQTANGAGG